MIPPTMWREIIKRFGMLGRFRELRRLLFWLLCWYAPRERQGTVFAALPKPASLDYASDRLQAALPSFSRYAYFTFPAKLTQKMCVEHPIRQLFPPSFQQGLIVWGFCAGLLPNASLEQSMLPPTLAKLHYRRKLLERGVIKRLDWSVGLHMLVKLRDMGVDVHPRTVIKAVQMMMIHFFGGGRSRKKKNRIMHATNTMPYAYYIQKVNRIWGHPLFVGLHLHGIYAVHKPIRHPRAVRYRRQGKQKCLGDALPSIATTLASEDTPTCDIRSSLAPQTSETVRGRAVDGSIGTRELPHFVNEQ